MTESMQMSMNAQSGSVCIRKNVVVMPGFFPVVRNRKWLQFRINWMILQLPTISREQCYKKLVDMRLFLSIVDACQLT